MTVSYQYEVASSTSGGFTRLLFMWRGSLYKLIYRELLLFVVAFGLLSAAYRNLFNEPQKRLFEKVVVYCEIFITYIPLSFVLGFYVAYVAGRWWQQYMAIPWPDKVMHSLALYVTGNDMQGRMVRRSLMRYLNLSLTLVLRSISSAVKRRFPTMDHLVEAGFMTPLELEMFQAVPNLEFNTYWIPCTWFIALLKDTKKSNRITDSQGLQTIVQEFNEFRSKCGLLWSYDWISIPLVYTQVVTLATYSFFLAALVGRQYLDETTSAHKKQFQMEVDIYIPLFTILQFFFYMGLLKVAEQLINPFGDDDEDFELNWLIDRHIKVSYLGVDTLMSRYPPLVKDKYFDDLNIILPYTGAAFAYKKKTYRGSVHNMQVPEHQQTMFLPEISEEEDDDHDSSCRHKINSKSSSFANLAHAASPSAGIWRSSGDQGSQLSCSNVEANFQQSEPKAHVVVEKFNTKAPWKNQRNPLELPLASNAVINRLEQQLWSSQSTLASIDSIQANADSPGLEMANPFDTCFQKGHSSQFLESAGTGATATQVDIETSNAPMKKEDSKTRSKILKYSSTGNIAQSLRHSFSKHLRELTGGEDSSGGRNILGRRQSSSSGQWKGVRWKPFIADSAGDAWSDNSDRRPSFDPCKHCKRPSLASESQASIPPSHHSSTDSVTASFQSINSNIQPGEVLPKPIPILVRSKPSKPFRSKSLVSVPGNVAASNEVLTCKQNLSTSSLPNISIAVSQRSSFLSTNTSNINNSSHISLEDQLPPLFSMRKSYSTSPRMFSKLQDTITEEQEMK